MSPQIVHALREGLWLVLLLAAPPLGAALVAGLASAALQAATQVEERTLSVVPRLLAALVALALCGPWIDDRLVRFTSAVLEAVPGAGRA